jgi:hypothetical protein
LDLIFNAILRYIENSVLRTGPGVEDSPDRPNGHFDQFAGAFLERVDRRLRVLLDAATEGQVDRFEQLRSSIMHQAAQYHSWQQTAVYEFEPTKSTRRNWIKVPKWREEWDIESDEE